MNILSMSKNRSKTPPNMKHKSPSKSHPQFSSPNHQHHSIQERESLKMFEVPHLNELNQQFHKMIEIPIDTQTSVFMAKSPQRCLHHNNIITLYCSNDHKPLCVTCMYQNTAHKKHKVMPINRATQDLQEQTNQNMKIIGKQLERLNSMVRSTHANLNKTEREFPDLLSRIDKFYMELHQMLVQKKQDQVDHIKQTWRRIRYEYTSLAQLLDKINVYAVGKISSIQAREGDQSLLFNRNVSNQLVHLSELFPPNLCTFRQTNYQIELTRFQQVKNVINNSLIFTSPYSEIVSRNSSRKKGSSSFKERASLSPIIKKSPLKEIKENDQLKKTPSKSPNRDTSLKKSGILKKK